MWKKTLYKIYKKLQNKKNVLKIQIIKMIWKLTTWNYILPTKYLKLCSHLNQFQNKPQLITLTKFISKLN
jgi:hypothetical protein